MDTPIQEEVKAIFLEYINMKKLRKTPERFAILEKIYSKTGHFDIDTLYIEMKNENYVVSRATLYNTIDLLIECDLVTRHLFDNNVAQYEKSYHFKQHDHLICTKCHQVMEFCDPRIQNIRKMVEKSLNFVIHRHALNLYGTCNAYPNCNNLKNTKAITT